MNSTERDVIARLCEQMPVLRRKAAAHSASAQDLLHGIEAKARTGHPISMLLDELIQVLDDDEVRGGMAPLPNLSPQPPSEELFVCPDGRCGREIGTLPAGPLPRCWLSSRLMRLRDPE